MAENMTVDQLKSQINELDNPVVDKFAILREIASLYNNQEESLCRDIVLRALEHRSSFGNLEPVLDSLVRKVGLFPYLKEEHLSFADCIAYEYHRPDNLTDDIVFHREQAEVYRKLIDGDNVILSAPTSFGKSKVIDAIIASGKYKNIAVIVPTIALIDEARRRLASAFSDQFKIVTQVTQMPHDSNVFIFTAERANVYDHFPKIDFFVIDEFYKIGATSEDPKRTAALNQTFYKLMKAGAQFYLLGPSVRQIPDGFEEQFRCTFYPTTFATVASEEIRIDGGSDPLARLCELVAEIGEESTLIYCKSPKRVNDVTKALLNAGVVGPKSNLSDAVAWLRENFHPDWIMGRAFEHGIGMHHGRLPRSIAQYAVRAFNAELLNVLVCTSTLIEGVNTKAKNIIILDNLIANKKYTFFTFNNIKGRSGRMFQHFVGKAYLFKEPPSEELPFVDFPIYTQGEDTAESVLVQMEDEDLTERSRERIEPLVQNQEIPLELIKKHSGIEPGSLVELAKRIKRCSSREQTLLEWNGFPSSESFRFTCEIIWSTLIDASRIAGVSSGVQLSYKIRQIYYRRDVRERILAELEPGAYAAKTVDEAIERVFEFDRTWASFELPRLLRAMSDVREHVIGGTGDYRFYAAQIENLFRNSFHVVLEEFGLPLQITDKIRDIFGDSQDIDEVLSIVKDIDGGSLHLDAFEQELLADCQAAL